MAGKPHNPIKTLALVNMFLLVGLIIFIIVAKQKSSDGTTLGYFAPKEDEDEAVASATAKMPQLGINPKLAIK